MYGSHSQADELWNKDVHLKVHILLKMQELYSVHEVGQLVFGWMNEEASINTKTERWTA